MSRKNLDKIISKDNMCLVCFKNKGELDMLCPHHIISKGASGTDDPENILTVCKICHTKIHTGEINILSILERLKKTRFWRWDKIYNLFKERI